MPAPEQEILLAPSQTGIQVKLEPAQTVFHSLLLLAKTKKMSGFGDWVNETLSLMPAMEKQRQQVVMIGLYYAVQPERSWPSFPEYVDHLAEISPLALRDKLMNAYFNVPCLDESEKIQKVVSEEDIQSVLSSADNFLTFLGERFKSEHFDRSLEAQAYAYVIDPPAMQSLVVNHFRSMWDKYLQAEWERVKPMLQDAVAAFEQVDYRPMSRLEAAEFITGQTLSDGHILRQIEQAEQVIFVPSAHVGPYLGGFRHGQTFGVIFGARLPEGTHYYAPDLSRAEILVRLSSLADDNRLRILRLIAEEGEKRSQEIMQRLDLSQSAASRHLKQLSATGYLIERRCEGAKCYTLNKERLEDTLRAVLAYLSNP
jgi:DNA-binding transcriptional ArsR family regulator